MPLVHPFLLVQPDELKQYFDNSPEELRAAINALCDALTALTASASPGFAHTAGIPAPIIQATLEYLHPQLHDAVVRQIPSGSSVTGQQTRSLGFTPKAALLMASDGSVLLPAYLYQLS